MPRRDPDKLDKKIGANILQVRTMRGITREELGSNLDVTQQQVQKYEEGRSRIPASTLVEIAAILDTRLSALFEGVGKELGDIEGGSKHAVSLFESFNDIESSELQKAISNLVKAIVIELTQQFKLGKNVRG